MNEYMTWGGLQAINARCHGCIYSYVKHGTLICGKASRTVANNLGVQECASYIKRELSRTAFARGAKEVER